MKIILLDRTHEMPLDIERQSGVMADSAVVVAGRPLFLPDFSTTWTARVYIAYRIGRLGKTIKARYASRYYDAITLALRLIPSDIPEKSSVCSFFDNAIALAPFFEFGDDELSSDGQPEILTLENHGFNIDRNLIAEVIERVSRYSTLRNGDIIMPEYQNLEVEIRPKIDLRGNIGHLPFAFPIR